MFALLLGLGIPAAIIIAWAFAAFSDVSGSGFRPVPRPGELTAARVWIPHDWQPRTWLERSGPGLRHDLISESLWEGSKLGSMASTAPNRFMERVSVGWPMPAMQWSTESDDAGRAAMKAGGLLKVWECGLAIKGSPRLSTGSLRRIPLRPVWVGLAVDAGVFAGVLWAVGLGFVRWRTARRIRRGECTACGYAVGQLAVCPECGRPRIATDSAAKA